MIVDFHGPVSTVMQLDVLAVGNRGSGNSLALGLMPRFTSPVADLLVTVVMYGDLIVQLTGLVEHGAFALNHRTIIYRVLFNRIFSHRLKLKKVIFNYVQNSKEFFLIHLIFHIIQNNAIIVV